MTTVWQSPMAIAGYIISGDGRISSNVNGRGRCDLQMITHLVSCICFTNVQGYEFIIFKAFLYWLGCMDGQVK
jgi:hypothetical protein